MMSLKRVSNRSRNPAAIARLIGYAGLQAGASCPLVRPEQHDERGKLTTQGANAEALQAILSYSA